MERWSTDWKNNRLRELYQGWHDCQACRLCDSRTNICFGNGNADADIMLIGETPGEVEDKTGHVFVGEAGILLTSLMEAAGIDRKDVFITNLVMCQPPEGRNPMKDEREACFQRLWSQIYTVDPMLIMPVGKAAMEALMGAKWKSITAKHGEVGFIEVPGLTEDKLVYAAIPVLHPGFILKEDKINRETQNWEQGGWAHKTMKDFVKARKRVEWLKNKYEPARRELLRVIQ